MVRSFSLNDFLEIIPEIMAPAIFPTPINPNNVLTSDQFEKFAFIYNRNAKLVRFLKLGAGILTAENVIGFLGNT